MPKSLLLLAALVAALASTGCGGDGEGESRFEIDDPLPKLHIFHIGATARPFAGPTPLKVEFAAKPFNETGEVRYRWRFDDGTTSTEQNPTHTFTKAGTYQVIVDAKDETEVGRWNLVLGAWPQKVWKRGIGGLSKAQILKIQRDQARRTKKRQRELREVPRQSSPD